MTQEQIRTEILKIKEEIHRYKSLDLCTTHLEENLQYLESKLEEFISLQNLVAQANLQESLIDSENTVKLPHKEEIREDATFRTNKGEAENFNSVENLTDNAVDHVYFALDINTAKYIYSVLKSATIINEPEYLKNKEGGKPWQQT